MAALIAYQIAPGPDAMLIVSRGVGQGWRVALASTLGMTLLAGFIQLPLLTLGVVSLLRCSRIAFELLHWVGAVYLIWLGVKLLLRSVAQTAPTRNDRLPRYSISTAVREGVFCNLTNPSPWIFMLALLPQFVDPSRGSVTAQLFILGFTQKFIGFLMLGSYAIAAGSLGSWLKKKPAIARWQSRVSGGAMICLGLRLLIAGDLRNASA